MRGACHGRGGCGEGREDPLVAMVLGLMGLACCTPKKTVAPTATSAPRAAIASALGAAAVGME